MRRIIVTLSGISVAACVSRTTTPPPAAPEPAPATAEAEAPAPPEEPIHAGVTPAPPREVPTSGGTSMENAELIAPGAAIEGWTARDQPRFYRLDVAELGELRLTWYTRIMTDRGQGAGVNPVLYLLDANGGKLAERMEATYATTGTGNFDQETIPVPMGNAPVFLQVDCQSCGDERVHYKIVLE